MKKEQAIKVLKLIRQWTRAEIMARHGEFNNLEFGNYFQIKLEKENEIRKILYGTDDLVALGEEWDLLKPRGSDAKRKKKLKELLGPQGSKLDK